MRYALIVALLAGPVATATAAENSLTLDNAAPSAVTNYPLQVGRPFMPGEITGYPQALVDGSAVLTQADVKTRWPDGSVKHAILSFIVPSVPANGRATVTFRNQTSGNNGGSLTPAQMLGANFDFDARMELTNAATTVSASARAMLQASAMTYWLQGGVATSVILADHSAARAFDVGFDAHRSFRPIVHATFWPALNKVRVRFIGEIANTEALQDQTYSLALKTGGAAPSTVYTKSSFTHTSNSRWTKEFWIGGAPSVLAINHNLAYLRETKLVPNYDTSKVPSGTAITNAYTAWTSASKDLYDAGNWTKYMPTTGGRNEIGPYPQWVVHWLYTGDKRMREKALGDADLAAAWPLHFREGSTGRWFDRANTVDAIGRVLSVNGRPTARVTDLVANYTLPADRITPVGARTNGGWIVDEAHQPDPFSIPYMLTGDYFYLEELLFWAAWGASETHPGVCWYCRGPSPTNGGIAVAYQVRGQAWLLRNRVHAATIAPDAAPEKGYFDLLTKDAIAIWEGERNITGTPNEGGTLWTWGHTTGLGMWESRGVPIAIPFWSFGNSGLVSSPVNPAAASAATSPWMDNMLLWSLGRAKELGYPCDALLARQAPLLIGQLTDTAYDPRMVVAYRLPTLSLANTYFTNWAGVRSAFVSSWDWAADFATSIADAQHGYAFIALSAASLVADQPGGGAAWAWMEANVLPAPVLDSDPKWAIVPRASAGPPSAPLLL